jgi:hypothetical protein
VEGAKEVVVHNIEVGMALYARPAPAYELDSRIDW